MPDLPDACLRQLLLLRSRTSTLDASRTRANTTRPSRQMILSISPLRLAVVVHSWTAEFSTVHFQPWPSANVACSLANSSMRASFSPPRGPRRLGALSPFSVSGRFLVLGLD